MDGNLCIDESQSPDAEEGEISQETMEVAATPVISIKREVIPIEENHSPVDGGIPEGAMEDTAAVFDESQSHVDEGSSKESTEGATVPLTQEDSEVLKAVGLKPNNEDELCNIKEEDEFLNNDEESSKQTEVKIVSEGPGKIKERGRKQTLEEIDEVEFFECNYCLAVFITQANLDKHVREHFRRKGEWKKKILQKRKESRKSRKLKQTPVDTKDVTKKRGRGRPPLKTKFKKPIKPDIEQNSQKPLLAPEDQPEKRGRGRPRKIPGATPPAPPVVVKKEPEKEPLEQTTSYGRGLRIPKAKEFNEYVVEIDLKHAGVYEDDDSPIMQEKYPKTITTFKPNIPKIKKLKRKAVPPSHRQKMYKCKLCGKVLKNKQNLMSHYICHGTDRPYKCELCKRRYSRKCVLKKHIEIVHAEMERKFKFECTICSKRMTSKVSLMQHVLLHLGEKPYQCGECGQRFMTPGRRRYHDLTQHIGRTFFCDICHKGFFLKSHLAGHIFERHLDTREHQCDFCCQWFSRLSYLQHHRQRHFTSKKKFNCHFCKDDFQKPVTMYYHIYTVHVEDQLSCYICSEKFACVEDTVAHHSENHYGSHTRYKCEECKASFRTEGRLLRHICNRLGVYAADIEMKCPHCPFTCDNYQLLEAHTVNCNSPEEEEDNEIVEHECGVCGLQFKREEKLILHEKIHYQEASMRRSLSATQKYVCQYCETACDSVRQKNKHELLCYLRPQDTVIFPCSFCPKNFRAQSYLSRHLERCPAAEMIRAAQLKDQTEYVDNNIEFIM